MAEVIDGEERLARLAQSHRRARWVLLALGIALPLGLYALLERQARRLDALGDHGRPTSATVTATGDNVSYEYAVGGVSYSWSVKATDAPYQPGQPLAIYYLPEDPSLSRPGQDPARATAEAAANRSFTRKAMLGVLLFFAVNLALLEVKARKLRQSERFVISPRAAGRVVALLLIACAVLADLSADSRVVFAKAFGAAPGGMPVAALVVSGNVLLLIPYFWVCEHVMRIVFQAIADRASLSRGSLIGYILFAHRTHPELARSRWIALAGFGYFVVLLGAWVSYAASRGL